MEYIHSKQLKFFDGLLQFQKIFDVQDIVGKLLHQLIRESKSILSAGSPVGWWNIHLAIFGIVNKSPLFTEANKELLLNYLEKWKGNLTITIFGYLQIIGVKEFDAQKFLIVDTHNIYYNENVNAKALKKSLEIELELLDTVY